MVKKNNFNILNYQVVDLKKNNNLTIAQIKLDPQDTFHYISLSKAMSLGEIVIKEVSYSGNHNAPAAMEGQINFIGVDAIIRYTIFNIGAGTRIHPGSTMVTLFIQKELF